jgi:hypothetical protein
MHVRLLNALLTASVVASGCSTVDVKSRVAPDTNLSQYHTYAFLPPRPGRPESIAQQQVRQALRQAMAQKGFIEAGPGAPPDFVVAYHVRERQQEAASWGDWGYGPAWGWGPDESYTYTLGTVIIDFVDVRTNRVFWRGTASQVVDHPDNPDPQKIDRAVTKVVNRYPVQVAAVPPPRM